MSNEGNILDDLFDNIQKNKKLDENIPTTKIPTKRGRKPKNIQSKVNEIQNVVKTTNDKTNSENNTGEGDNSLTLTLAPEGDSLISKELERFEFQLNEQFFVLESINPMDIINIEDRLKASKLKIELLQKLPSLMSQLDELKSKEDIKIKARGARELSPIETGELDTFSEEDFKDLDDE